MSDEHDEAIDALLRAQFEGAVPDDNFCNRVMDQLPVRRHARKWPLGAGCVAGIALCWFTLWSAPLTHDAWRDWMSGEWSTSAVMLFSLMMSMALLAVAWAVAEAHDHHYTVLNLSPRKPY